MNLIIALFKFLINRNKSTLAAVSALAAIPVISEIKKPLDSFMLSNPEVQTSLIAIIKTLPLEWQLGCLTTSPSLVIAILVYSGAAGVVNNYLPNLVLENGKVKPVTQAPKGTK